MILTIHWHRHAGWRSVAKTCVWLIIIVCICIYKIIWLSYVRKYTYSSPCNFQRWTDCLHYRLALRGTFECNGNRGRACLWVLHAFAIFTSSKCFAELIWHSAEFARSSTWSKDPHVAPACLSTVGGENYWTASKDQDNRWHPDESLMTDDWLLFGNTVVIMIETDGTMLVKFVVCWWGTDLLMACYQ